MHFFLWLFSMYVMRYERTSFNFLCVNRVIVPPAQGSEVEASEKSVRPGQDDKNLNEVRY